MSTCKEEYRNIIAVTNRKLSSRPFLEQMERVCRLQPKAVILREKDLQEEMYEELAVKVIELCKQYQVPCMLHTYLETARKLQHPYIHLPLFLLRENSGKLNDFVEIGCSIHSVEEAEEAQKLGATYLTAGHIYTTDCKKGLPPRGIDFLKEVCGAVTIPVYAIGGIHAGTGQIQEVIKCGAFGGCIMSEMMRI